MPPLPGAKTKNLLRDKPGRRHFLVCVPAYRQVDLRTLSDAIGCGRLSFGSADRLTAPRGGAGAVTLFAVFNDPGRAVELFVDAELWACEAFPVPPAGEHRHARRQPRGRDALPRADRLPVQGDRGTGARGVIRYDDDRVFDVDAGYTMQDARCRMEAGHCCRPCSYPESWILNRSLSTVNR